MAYIFCLIETDYTFFIRSIINYSEMDVNAKYTKEGLALWLNNMPERSVEHFKAKIDESTPIFAGYTFVICMVSLYKFTLSYVWVGVCVYVFVYVKPLRDLIH